MPRNPPTGATVPNSGCRGACRRGHTDGRGDRVATAGAPVPRPIARRRTPAPDRCGARRRPVLPADMIARHGRVRREGGAIDLVTERPGHPSEPPRPIGMADGAFPFGHGRGDAVVRIPGPRSGSGIGVPARGLP